MAAIDQGVKRWLEEGLWVIVGQVFSAVGTLAGLRLLTDLLPPHVFGEVVLASGVAILVNGLAALPLMQGLLRYYPEAVSTNSVGVLRSVINTYLMRLMVSGGAICLAGFLLYGWFVPISPWIGPLVVALLTTDILRQRELTFLNAARRQRLTALWMTSDVWARPALAWAAIAATGATAVATLAGYVAAAAVLLAVFMRCRIREEQEQDSSRRLSVQVGVAGNSESSRIGQSDKAQQQLAQALIRYTVPLMPLGVIGWISGQADRYLMGGMIGMEQAGIYAALHGIVNRPFLMAGGTLELWIRPVYYEAVVRRELVREKQLLQLWIGSVIGVALIGFLVFGIWHREIAGVLLATPYRSASWLMPWVAAGYGLLLIAQVYGRVCYAHDDTKAVLLGEAVGSAVALVATLYGLMQFGFAGAAYAIPVYFSTQLIVSMILAWRATGRVVCTTTECASA